jgi:transposase
MAMGTRQGEQPPLWIATSDLPTAPGYPFYARLNTVLDAAGFDAFVEAERRRFYAALMGRPGLAPDRYFRMLLVGYFEGLGSVRGIAWRAADALAVRRFLHLGLEGPTPDRSTISRTRRLIDVDTHRAVFTWVQTQLVAHGLLRGQTVAVDATTLEANAAMRSIVRRDTGESYQAYPTQLAEASSITTPTREALARFDRRRQKKSSNQDWTHPVDPDATITKMKDGRTHLAHKAEHAVDVDSGAVVSVRVDGADVGDTTTVIDSVVDAAEQLERAGAPHRLDELIADKGYHSNRTLIDLHALDVRPYIAEPDRGRRHWRDRPEAQALVYANRRRLRGARGKRLRRQRAEYVERSFAHLYLY